MLDKNLAAGYSTNLCWITIVSLIVDLVISFGLIRYSIGKPHNPLVNAGAIIVTSLLKVGFEFRLSVFSDYTLRLQRQSNLADRFDYVSGPE